MTSLLPAQNDALQLKDRARQFMAAYPDIHDMAYAAASKILLKHTQLKLNPEKVYWHRFSNAVSSTRSFTGWVHVGPPTESMTFIELVMHRFNARDQEAWDELQVYGGFYTDGPDHDVFDERNEIRMLPKDVLDDFWALDFSAAYTLDMERFWAVHSENFRTLAKAHFLAAAGQSRRSGKLSEQDFRTVFHAVADTSNPVMTLDRLQAKVPPRAGITLRSFDIGGVVSRDILRIVDVRGRQILYVPGESSAFHCFASEAELYEWVRARLSDKASRMTFSLHFLRSAADREQSGAAFDGVVKQILRRKWFELKLVNPLDQVITGDVFEHFRDLARREMAADATLLLTSNASLRKQLWIGYLSAFTHVFGGMAPLGWPIALTLVGAGIANVALNIDQSIHGANASLRRAGVEAAIFSSIFVVLNLAMFAGLGKAGQEVTTAEIGAPASPLPLEPVIPLNPVVTEADIESPLAGLEGNVVLNEAVPIPTKGPLRSIHVLANGETWISLDNLPYYVHYSAELRSWAVVDPDSPFAFQGAKPVRLNAEGKWELASPPKLKGGMESAGTSSQAGSALAGKPYPTTTSTFWDAYMRFNPLEEMQLSRAALVRQREAVNVMIVPDNEVVSDEDGFEKYVDRGGSDYRIFKTESGRYYGGRIGHYVQEDHAYNLFLRTGTPYSYYNSVAIIEKLANDLDEVGLDNAVDLYRGGSGGRGTSGITYRSGVIKPGDTLVNTDITSFSENPYVARNFANSQVGENSGEFHGVGSFDDTSIIYVLPAKSYQGATPIGPFSGLEEEAESVFLPGHYFKVKSIEEVTGQGYKFIKVEMGEIDKSQASTSIYDLRTGKPFSREQYAVKLGAGAQSIVDRFFPLDE